MDGVFAPFFPPRWELAELGDTGTREWKGKGTQRGVMEGGVQFSLASPGLGILASPEVISLRSSVNDKDIELLDLRRQLKKALKEVGTLKVSLGSAETARRHQRPKAATNETDLGSSPLPQLQLQLSSLSLSLSLSVCVCRSRSRARLNARTGRRPTPSAGTGRAC